MLACRSSPVGIVICATVTVRVAGPEDGSIQKTAPFSVFSPPLVFHAANSMPMEPRALAESPSVRPTVSQLSKAADARTSISSGLTPPRSAPNGLGSWTAGGTTSAALGAPKMVSVKQRERLLCQRERESERERL